MKKNELDPQQFHTLVEGGTEMPFSGEYNDHYQKGIYVCGWCNNPLYTSEDKFSTHIAAGQHLMMRFQDRLHGNCVQVKSIQKFYVRIAAGTWVMYLTVNI